MRTKTRLAAVALIGLSTLVLAGCKNPVTGEDFSPADVRLTISDAVAANPDITKDELRALLTAEYGVTVPLRLRDRDGDGVPNRLEERADGCFQFGEGNTNGAAGELPCDRLRDRDRDQVRDQDRDRDRDRDRDGEGDRLRDRDRDRDGDGDGRDRGGMGGR